MDEMWSLCVSLENLWNLKELPELDDYHCHLRSFRPGWQVVSNDESKEEMELPELDL